MYDIFIEELYIKPKSETKWETELCLDPLFDWKTANADKMYSENYIKDTILFGFITAWYIKYSQRRNTYITWN